MAGNMTREKWIDAGSEIAEHIKALKRICVKYDIEQLNMGVFKDDEFNSVFFFDGDSSDDNTSYYDVRVWDSKIELCENGSRYYTRS